MYYEDRADNIASALMDAESILESLSEREDVEEEYGTDITGVLSDIKYALSDLDDLDTDYHSLEEMNDYAKYEELDRSRDIAVDEIEDAITALENVVSDLRYA